MKIVFRCNGQQYIAPSIEEARLFCMYWGEDLFWNRYRRFISTWKLKTVERAPSFGQLQRVDMENKIEY